MPIETFNPAGLPQVEVYRQVSVATGTRTVYIAGQVARTADGTPVGAGDLAAQTEQALVNVHTALNAAGAQLTDIAKMTVYVVGWTPERMPELGAGMAAAAGRLGGGVLVPITLIGVAALAEPDILIEIEAVAVLP
jgi:enamine deaminase RidA (YjgF/YER057c/UK114 family)